MCYLCAKNVSTEKVLLELTGALENPEFDKYNTTSVQFLLYSCVGIHGEEAKSLGIQVMTNMVQWMKLNKYILYRPKCGLENMYHPDVLARTLEWCKTYSNDDKLDEEAVVKQLFDKIHEFDLQIGECWDYKILKKIYDVIGANDYLPSSTTTNIRYFVDVSLWCFTTYVLQPIYNKWNHI